MSALITSPNLANPDEIYQRLNELHAGRTDAESMRINAKLILILANHIGSDDAILEAIRLAGFENE